MMATRRTHDDRGAVMLIAVFFAIFAVALLYYLIGLSTTLLFREKLQDAADSAAFSAAVIHARGMNFIVLLNIVMAALLAVLVTLKLVETLAIIGIVIASSLAWATFGASLAFVPPLNELRSQMQEAYDSVQPKIFRALRALNSTASAVKDVVPTAATTLVAANLAASVSPRGVQGAAFGSRSTLPVTDGSFDELCGHAGKVTVELAEAALSTFGLSAVIGWLEDPMQSLTSSMSGWFCGDDAPQSYTQGVKQGYPRTGQATDCEQAGLDGRNRSDTAQLCNDANSDQAAATPNRDTGACQDNCTLDGPYDRHVKLAREQCDPTQPPPPFTYEYQKRAGTVDYTWNGDHWVRGEPKYDAPVRATSDARPPCGPPYLWPKEAVGYNRKVRTHKDFNEVLPVCSTEQPPMFRGGHRGDVESIHFTDVTQILGCQREETRQIPIDAPSPSSSDDSAGTDESGDSKSPKKLEDSLDANTFQIRALVSAQLDTAFSYRVLLLSLWKDSVPPDPLSNLRPLGNFAVAQAEYFYDARGGASDKMWNMNWRARLRRFRLPPDNGFATVARKHLGTSYDSLLAPLRSLDNLVAH